jgi:hypothetical protein
MLDGPALARQAIKPIDRERRMIGYLIADIEPAERSISYGVNVETVGRAPIERSFEPLRGELADHQSYSQTDVAD